MSLAQWEERFEQRISEVASAEDPAHDLLHFRRVVGLAKRLCRLENGREEVVVPAAWLHDLVIVPKNSPLRSQASRMSAQRAIEFLTSIDYPAQYLADIAHAIEGHSFSANIEVTTIEARIIQDADRLDGLGAIGLARCFATAGLLKRPFYSSEDPFCELRPPDDSQFTLDHFFTKFFKTVSTLKTESGRTEGLRRAQIMREYLSNLKYEIATL